MNEQRLNDICQALTDDFDTEVIPTTPHLKDALDKLHGTGVSMTKVLPSLKDLTESPKYL